MSLERWLSEAVERFRALVGFETGAVISDLAADAAAARLIEAVSKEGRPGSSITAGEAGPHGGTLRSGIETSGQLTSQMVYRLIPADPGVRIEGRSEPAPALMLALAGWFAFTAIGVLRNLLEAFGDLAARQSFDGDALTSAITGAIAFALGFLGVRFLRLQLRRDQDLMLAFIARIVEGRVHHTTPPPTGPLDISATPQTADRRNKPIVS